MDRLCSKLVCFSNQEKVTDNKQRLLLPFCQISVHYKFVMFYSTGHGNLPCTWHVLHSCRIRPLFPKVGFHLISKHYTCMKKLVRHKHSILISTAARDKDKKSFITLVPWVDGDVASVSNPFTTSNARRERFLGGIFGRKVDGVSPPLRSMF